MAKKALNEKTEPKHQSLEVWLFKGKKYLYGRLFSCFSHLKKY